MELFDYLKILDELGYGDKNKVEFEKYWDESNVKGLLNIAEYAIELAKELGIKLEPDNPDEDPDNDDDDDDNDGGPKLNNDGLFKKGNEYILGVKGAYNSKLKRVPLIEHQGRAYENFKGTCGLCSTANAMRLLRIKNVTEKEIIDVAVENGLCIYDESYDPGHNGGTTIDMRAELAEHYGAKPVQFNDLTMDNIIESLKNGASVTFSVHAEFLMDGIPKRLPQKQTANHCITLVEVVYCEDGKTVKGINVEDTGGWVGTSNGFKFLSLDFFQKLRKATNYASGIANYRGETEE